MSVNYKKVSYFESRPDVVAIFDDLDNYLDFCRFNLLPYNPADLYNRSSPVWSQYYTRVYKKTSKNNKKS